MQPQSVSDGRDPSISGPAGLVSVVIPTYNYESFVLEAVDSALAQTYAPLEVIVVDDGSTDGTQGALKKYRGRVRIIRQENQGLSAARNAGIDAAQGRFIALLDADDRWAPEKIEKQMSLLMSLPPTVGLVCSGATRVRGTHRSREHESSYGCKGMFPARFRDDLLVRNIVEGSGSSVLLRKECFERAGFFDRELRSSEDWDMWLRISEHFDFAMVDEPLVEIRVHTSSMSKNVGQMLHYHARVIDKNLSGGGAGWHRRVLRRKSYSYMFYGNGLEYNGADDARERRCIVKSLLWYPAPTFYPKRYMALLRTVIGSRRFGTLRRRFGSAVPETRGSRDKRGGEE